MDAALAELPSQTTDRPKVKPFFNKENAQAYSIKAAEARKQARIAREQAAEAAKMIPEPAPVQPDELYRLNSLTRTRELIKELEDKLEGQNNPQAVNYLAGSIAKLRDIEQKLANRPLPGSRRPGRESTTKRSGEVGPVE